MKERENAVILSQERIAQGIYSMWLKTKAAGEARPGQFISMYTNDGSKLLPRPISICEIDKENGSLRVVYRVTGKVLSRHISRRHMRSTARRTSVMRPERQLKQ